MPADIYTVNRTKDLILSFIKARGPSLPVHIARDVKVSPLFAAAFLSELYGEGKLKMSALKVGSSSLYYLPDQTAQLENFTEHLNGREKEAFALLKQEKILDDEKLEPVTRVALRALKDFALPLRATQDGQPKLFWRFFLLTEEEAQQRLISADEAAEKRKAPKPAPAEQPQITPLPLPVAVESLASRESPQPVIEARTPTLLPMRAAVQRPKRPPIPQSSPSITLPFPQTQPVEKKQTEPLFPFSKSVQEHLAKRDIQFLEIIEDKKKELRARVSLETPLGPQHFFLIAKDKKRLKTEELIEALQQAHAEKLPALLLAPGDLEKKAHATLAEWSALLKYEKLQ